MTVTVLIINWNGRDYLSETLKKLPEVSETFRVLIVDNASEDDSVEFIRHEFPRVQLVANSTFLSFAENLNIGLSQATNSGSEYIWLLGSDVVVDDNSLKYLLELADKYKDVGMISSKVYVYGNKDRKIHYAGGIMDWYTLLPQNRGQEQVDVGQFEHDIETDFAAPISTLIKSRVVKEVGLVDQSYYEGFDWLDYCYKLRRFSWRLMFSCQSHVWYRQKYKNDLPIFIKDYFSIRNSLLFGLRYGPALTKLSLIKNAFRQYFFGTPWQRRAVLDFFTGNFGRGSYQTE